MKSLQFTALAALAARQAMGHATFQQLWVNGVDKGAECARVVPSNSPVTNVGSNDIRCNANTSPASSNCAVSAGDVVTVEMHQHNDRSCANEAIGGAHHGPVMAYLTKVDDAATADGSTGWYKIFENSWKKNPSGGGGSDDFWGNKDMNNCCGLVDIKIPDDTPAGDYLLRAETIALHAAGGSNGAQFYLTCYQLTVEGSGSASPPTVSFPGAYSASDPGILVNIYTQLDNYVAPGPSVVEGGTVKEAGGDCTGCEATCTAAAFAAPTA